MITTNKTVENNATWYNKHFSHPPLTLKSNINKMWSCPFWTYFLKHEYSSIVILTLISSFGYLLWSTKVWFQEWIRGTVKTEVLQFNSIIALLMNWLCYKWSDQRNYTWFSVDSVVFPFKIVLYCLIKLLFLLPEKWQCFF